MKRDSSILGRSSARVTQERGGALVILLKTVSSNLISHFTRAHPVAQRKTWSDLAAMSCPHYAVIHSWSSNAEW